MSNPIHIVVVDDHPLIHEGLKQILALCPHIHIAGQGFNGYDAVRLVTENPCDILLLDLNMPLCNGLDAAKILRQQNHPVKILLLTVESDIHTLQEAIELKVDGYILKDTAGTTLLHAVEHIYHGGKFIDQDLTKQMFSLVQETPPIKEDSKENKIEPSIQTATSQYYHLSAREEEILHYISKGMSNKEIAAVLQLSEKTVRNYITGLFKKINVKDRVQATIFALNLSL